MKFSKTYRDSIYKGSSSNPPGFFYRELGIPFIKGVLQIPIEFGDFHQKNQNFHKSPKIKLITHESKIKATKKKTKKQQNRKKVTFFPGSGKIQQILG